MKKFCVFLFFTFITVIYLHNLTRDVYSGDIGDLVTAAYVGGVPHPPGYPLFTLLGFILSHLPIPLPVVSRVGLISVFSSLAALIIFYKFCLRVTKSVFLGLLSTSILAFSYLFWLNAEIPEVFALNNFFVVAILYTSILFYEEKKEKYLYLLALLTGLAFAHHQTIILIYPGIILLILKHFKFIYTKRRALISLALFLLGFSVYLYVPIAASRNPAINWDNASTLKNFINLFLRKDYGFAPNLNRTPFKVQLIHVVDYFKTFITLYSYQIIFISLLGVLKLFKTKKRLMFSLIIIYILSGPLFVFYAAIAITSAASWGTFERFYTLSSVLFMFFVPFGFLMIKNFLEIKFSKKIYSYIILSYFIIIPYFQLKYNFSRTDLSKTKIGETLAQNTFLALPKNSVLFVSGDTNTFDAWYGYYVLGMRNDTEIINPPGVGNNLYLDKEINEFHKKYPEVNSKEIVPKTFNEIRKKRPIFSTYPIGLVPKDSILLPKGLVFHLSYLKDIPNEQTYIKIVEENWKKIQPQRRETLSLSEKNFITPEITLIYSNGLIRIGDFIDSYYKDPQKAEQYYRRALWIDDTNPQGYSGLAIVLYKVYKDCEASIKNIEKAISIYPNWKKYYQQQYFFYSKCKKDIKNLNNLKKKYKSIFKEDIEKQIKEQ